jgi:hypothetical protein
MEDVKEEEKKKDEIQDFDPLSILFDVLTELSNIDATTAISAACLSERIYDVLWDSNLFEEMRALIPAELEKKYDSVKGYIRNAKEIDIKAILNKQAYPFTPIVAEIIAARIEDEVPITDRAEFISLFKDKLWAMVMDDCTEDIDEVKEIMQIIETISL